MAFAMAWPEVSLATFPTLCGIWISENAIIPKQPLNHCDWPQHKHNVMWITTAQYSVFEMSIAIDDAVRATISTRTGAFWTSSSCLWLRLHFRWNSFFCTLLCAFHCCRMEYIQNEYANIDATKGEHATGRGLSASNVGDYLSRAKQRQVDRSARPRARCHLQQRWRLSVMMRSVRQ